MIPGVRAACRPAPVLPRAVAGFTLVELIIVMVLVGALAVVALPKLFDTQDWRLRAFGDQMLAELQAMQRQALTQRRSIVATIAGTGLRFAYDSGEPLGTLDCPAGTSPCIAEAAPRSFVFNAKVGGSNSGRSLAGGLPAGSSLTITVAAGSYSKAYRLEQETGLVYPLP